jgi:hypothetical protein
MNTKEKLEKELSKVIQHLAMKDSNDGWWNLYMEERKSILEKLIKELDNK